MKLDTRTKKHLLVYALVTVLILSVPFMAMQFDWRVTDPGNPVPERVNWKVGDFILAALLLFGSGVVYESLSKGIEKRNKRIALGIIVLLVLAFLWVAAATGFGS